MWIFLIPIAIICLIWVQETVDQTVFEGEWNLPNTKRGPIWGVFTSPFSHSDFNHLRGNTVWFIPLSWLVLSKGLPAYCAVWAGVYLNSLLVWRFWPRSEGHGLSGVCYGLIGYLLMIGLLKFSLLNITLSLVCIIMYRYALPSLLPWLNPKGVSWIGHAGGFIGGVFAACFIHS